MLASHTSTRVTSTANLVIQTKLIKLNVACEHIIYYVISTLSALMIPEHMAYALDYITDSLFFHQKN